MEVPVGARLPKKRMRASIDEACLFESELHIGSLNGMPHGSAKWPYADDGDDDVHHHHDDCGGNTFIND